MGRSKSHVWVAIVNDGNGGWHIFEKLCNEYNNDVAEFEQRCSGIGLALSGSLVTMYRKCDVVERARL